MKQFRNQKGQGLIEYLIIVAIIAIGTLSIMRVLGEQVSANYTKVVYALRGKKKSVEVPFNYKDHVKRRHLGNFLDGSGEVEKK